MDSVMANLPKISLLESPTVEDTDTQRLDVVMVIDGLEWVSMYSSC